MLDVRESALCCVGVLCEFSCHLPLVFCAAKAAGTTSFIFSLSLLTVRSYKAVSFSVMDSDLFGLCVPSSFDCVATLERSKWEKQKRG